MEKIIKLLKAKIWKAQRAKGNALAGGDDSSYKKWVSIERYLKELLEELSN